MLSDEEIKEQEKELKEMENQIKQEAEEVKEKAAETLSPEPTSSPVSNENPETISSSPPQESPEVKQTPKDDPMEWAKSKGYKTSEDMARALLQKEREFHDSRQKEKANAPSVPDWRPEPEWRPSPGYAGGYTPPPYVPRGDSYQELASMYPQIDPEDLRRFMPVVVDAAQAIARRERMELERRIDGISRSTERNNELMTLMQDSAFRDGRVQKEIHAILDSDPSIFQRERAPLAYAYEKAMVNMARKTLQQGLTEASQPGPTPPVTASGGNGSANTIPRRITEKEFDSWSVKDQEAYLKSNGKVVPKK